MIRKAPHRDTLTAGEKLFCLCCILYYFLWIFAPFDYGPDEKLRYQTSLFLFQSGHLPVGTELLDPVWGASYAQLPNMLRCVLDALFMKLGSLFSCDSRVLLLCARFVGVLCGGGSVYFAMRTAKLLFHPPYDWLMVILIAALPQFAFLTSYVNYDILALFASFFLLWVWVSALQSGWNYKKAFLCSVGIAICALSYHNAYCWILCSIPFFFVTYLSQHHGDRGGCLRMAVFIFLLSCLFAGYFFVRQLVVYGDLLGWRTTRLYRELYALPEFKPSQHITPFKSGCSLWDMLTKQHWLRSSAFSFIGCFGYFALKLRFHCYLVWFTVIIPADIGILLLCQDAVRSHRKFSPSQVTFFICLALCILIPLTITLYYSYTVDFQPQGRYMMPALPVFAVMAVAGLRRLLVSLSETVQRRLVCLLCLMLVLVTLYAFSFSFLPDIRA